MDRQAHLSQCLDKLMADVQRNLEPKNRDKFTQVHPSSHLQSASLLVLFSLFLVQPVILQYPADCAPGSLGRQM